MNHHVRNEVATRELLGRIGDDKELGETPRMRSWCDEVTSDWHFQDTDHVLLSLKYGCSMTPCRACLKAIRDVINKEIGE